MIALGTDSGPILVPFWNPKSDQIGPKRVPKSIKKAIEKHVEFGIDFSTIFGQFWLPTWGAQGPTNQGFGVKSAPGTTLGPEWSPGPIKARFLVDLGRCLIDLGRFWSILGRRWADFWVDV